MKRYEGGRNEDSLDSEGASTRSSDSFSDSNKRDSGGGDVLLIKISNVQVNGVGAKVDGDIAERGGDGGSLEFGF